MLVSNGGHDPDHSRSGVSFTSIGLTSKSRSQSGSGLFSVQPKSNLFAWSTAGCGRPDYVDPLRHSAHTVGIGVFRRVSWSD